MTKEATMKSTRHTLLQTTTERWRVTDNETDYAYEGTAQEIVLDMSRQDFIVSCKTDYMLEVQDRVFELFGTRLTVVPSDFTEFLRQLEALGLIKITVI